MKRTLLWLALSSMLGTAHAERAVRSLREMRQENLIVQQWDNSCGAAALATILTFYQRYPVTERQVAQGMLRQTDALRVRHRGGFSLLDMQRYAARAGFVSNGYTQLTLDDLARRAPMIVPIKLRGYDHFVIVPRVGDKVDIADPGFGNYQMARPDFARIWQGIGFRVEGRRRG